MNFFDFTTTGAGVNPVSFNVTQAKGSLNVALSPAGAISAGAQWYLDNNSSTLQNSGTTMNNITTGTHTLNFKSIPGWMSPISKNVVINTNQTTNESGTYTVNAGYVSVSQGATVSPSTVNLDQNFSVSFTLKETLGASVRFESITVAILKPDGTNLYDLQTYPNITISANGTWSPGSTSNSQIYSTNPVGTYKVIIRGKVAGGVNFFDFTTTGAGVNPASLIVSQSNGSISPPSLISPIGNINLGNEIVFSWNSVPNAARYRIKICTDQNMTSQISGSPFEAVLGALNISVSSTLFSSGQTYYWQAASILTNDVGDWGSFGPAPPMSFVPSQNPTLNLISPSPNQSYTNKTIQFQWNSIPNATNYELYVDNASGFGSSEVSPSQFQELTKLTQTSFTISENWLTPGYTYHWKVVAKTPNGNIESESGIFTYDPKLNPPKWVPLYRTFNSAIVDHFYCSSDTHLKEAINSGYRFEGVEGYVSLTPFEVTSSNKLMPIYRFNQKDSNNPKMNCHYYTADNSDRDNRIIQGWSYEGIVGYGFNLPEENLVLLNHTFLDNATTKTRDNFYTISEIQKNNSISLFGYLDQIPICYVSATGNNSTMPWLTNSIEVGAGANPQNGNLSHYTTNIFTIPEGKVGLNYGHLYNSLAVRYFKNINPLGNGWSHSYNISLSINDNNIFVVWPDEVNVYNKSNLKSITSGVYDIITLSSNNQYQIRKKDQTVYTFEKLSNVANMENTYLLTSITDRIGNQIVLGYNIQGWLKWVKSPVNRLISFTYYPQDDDARYGLIHFVKDSLALNRRVEYIFDDQRNLIKFIDAKSQTTKYAYNTNSPFDHLLDTITFADGTKITNKYDPVFKRLTSQNFISNQTSKLTTISIPTSKLVTVTDETNKSITLKSDAIGNITELITPKGHAKYNFTDNDNPTKPTEIIDGNSNSTLVVYNKKGDPLTITKPLGITHQYQWNETNDIVKYIKPGNAEINFTYTSGNLSAINTFRGTTNISYFSNGNINKINDPLSQTITYSYDLYNNVKSISDVLGNSTKYGYDGASRVINVTDANMNSINYKYFDNDLLQSTEDALTKTTRYNYDGANRLTSIQDARGNITSMVFDPNSGFLTQVKDQLQSQTNYSYYDNGLLKSSINRNNQTINYAYDEINRLTSITGITINRNMTYDLNDNLVKLLDNYGSLDFVYDKINRIESYTDFYGNQVQYIYDDAGNIKNIIYPGNKMVVYEYDPDGLMKNVTDWQNKITKYSYRNDGTIDRIDLPNGTYTKYVYDAAGRLTGLSNNKSDGTIINSYSYTLDKAGNQIGITIKEPLTPPVLAATSVLYTYDEANRIKNAGNITFVHDKNGNLTQETRNGSNTNFSFDSENMLNGIRGTSNSSYIYDGVGIRRAATRNGLTTRYVMDINGSMENVLVETNLSNQAQYYYIYGNGLLYRIKSSDNSIQYYHYDSRGSTIAITDQNQNITHKYSYDAFGKVTNLTEPESEFNPYRYIGKFGVMYESPSLYFMRARYYNPEIGRFISEDPVWDVNLFSYTNNNPLIYNDPNGETQQVCSIQRQEELKRQLIFYQQESARYAKNERNLFYLQKGVEVIKTASELSLSRLIPLGFLSSSLNSFVAAGVSKYYFKDNKEARKYLAKGVFSLVPGLNKLSKGGKILFNSSTISLFKDIAGDGLKSYLFDKLLDKAAK